MGAHAGDLARVRAFPSSDTIFGALCWAARQLGGNEAVERWLAPFVARDPPLLITSALPVIEDSRGRAWFVPMPVRRPGLAPDALPDRKMLRRANYIDVSLLPWLAGKDSASVPRRAGGALERAEPGQGAAKWTEAAIRPHVTVDRVTSASALFAAGNAHFRRPVSADGSSGRTGMYVGIHERQAGATERVLPLLRLLSETGIGGERSTGAGAFDMEILTDAPLPLAARARGMLLSLCWPPPDEVARGALDVPAGFGYRLAERSGWVSSPDWHGHRSRAVTMLQEGSHLTDSGGEVAGGMPDVTPDPSDVSRHRVYRYGYGCFLDEGIVLEPTP